MNQILGKSGEKTALRYLEGKGYQLVCQNYRWRSGEIDLIMKMQNTLVFVEVKTRKTTRYGLPREAVTFAKQKKIYQTALQYIQRFQIKHLLFRFDVIEVFAENGEDRINHIERAFY